MAKDFGNIMARAQKLMLDENFNQKVESRAKKGDPFDISSFERQAFGVTTENMGQSSNEGIHILNEGEINFDSEGARKMPDAIRESFRKMPSPVFEDTSLDAIGQALSRSNVKMVTEERTTNDILPKVTEGAIDYSLIKSIIDESVSRHFKMLNEGQSSQQIKGMRLINGNTFQFIDGKGNLYEATLKLKKRAKQ